MAAHWQGTAEALVPSSEVHAGARVETQEKMPRGPFQNLKMEEGMQDEGNTY